MSPTRARLAALMDATVANRDNWHYAQYRPCGSTVTREQAVRGVVYADCSAGAAIVARLAGAPNPLHAGRFDGYGNTGSCWAHLEHIPEAKLDVGDCVVYGRGPDGTHHMAIVRQPGADPLLWSNGWEQAPEFIRFSTERVRQGRAFTCCRLLPPDPMPTLPPEADPFWVWLRWRLGEGEFLDHKRDPALRPKNAPRAVPLRWWLRERRFLDARKMASA